MGKHWRSWNCVFSASRLAAAPTLGKFARITNYSWITEAVSLRSAFLLPGSPRSYIFKILKLRPHKNSMLGWSVMSKDVLSVHADRFLMYVCYERGWLRSEIWVKSTWFKVVRITYFSVKSFISELLRSYFLSVCGFQHKIAISHSVASHSVSTLDSHCNCPAAEGGRL